MGNAHSHGHPHNRLVKPKTNSNSPSLAPDAGQNVESPSSLASRYAHLSTQDRQQIRSQLLSPLQTEFEHRDSLEEDDTLEDTLEDTASNVNRRLSSRSNSMSCFGSKTSSITRLSSLPASKVSLVQSSQPVDRETAISILHEVQTNASPEDMAALREIEPRPTSAVDSLTGTSQNKLCNPTHPAPRLDHPPSAKVASVVAHPW